MAQRTLTHEDAVNAVYGGCVLGGGGGGIIEDGLAKVDALYANYGGPTLVTIDELAPDALVACVALVGAPSAKDSYYDQEQIIASARMINDALGGKLQAIMTNENGAGTTTNGWLQAAALGLPVLDAPANGRAHPTGSMGSMNLHEVSDFVSMQAYAGGSGDAQLSGVVSARLGIASDIVRTVSVHAGGMVAVCRNPVAASYVAENGAPGAISQAIGLGAAYHAAPEGPARVQAVAAHLGGSIVKEGAVEEVELRMESGFDVGRVVVDGAELTFWNEYMTFESGEERLGTFPDLIMTLDSETGVPIITARIEQGQRVSVLHVPAEKLILGSPMRNTELLRAIEPIVQKNIVSR